MAPGGCLVFPTRVLLAADGSSDSDLARDRVLDLIGHSNAALEVIHVGLVSPWTNPKTLSSGQVDRMREEAQVVLDGEIAALAERGVHARGHLRMGRATDEILRLRDEIDADLIVLGSRGTNAFVRVLLGSDAEGVVRHAPCPVLVVRSER